MVPINKVYRIYKTCNTCNRVYHNTAEFVKYLGEGQGRDYFNCMCGSTLLVKRVTHE